MRIGFDISMLVYQGSGIATYTYNLIKNLLIYDKKNEYRLFYSSLRRPKNFYYLNKLRNLGAKVYDLHFPFSLIKFGWGKRHLIPVEWFIGKVDIYHSSDFLRPPLFRKTRGITTIHDLIWKINPDWHTPEIIEAHDIKMEKTIHYKDVIIVPSNSSKKDLLKFYSEVKRRNKIYIIYEGVDEKFRPVRDRNTIKKVLKKYHLKYPKKYLLYVGAVEPRKNLEKTVRIFTELIKDKKYADFEFLVVGRAHWLSEGVFKLVKQLRLENKVKFIGYVEDEDINYFYNASQVLICLSLYEGFGLPPFEASRCKIPSLIYRNSSLKEFFPKNYPFAKKGNELSALKTLINKRQKIPFNFVQNFTWERYCKSFLRILYAYEN